MDATTFDSIGALTGPGEPAARPTIDATPELGREDFLRLLIAKLENQDPLEPTTDTEFVSQLATFSSLEQLVAVNDNLQGLARSQGTLINSQALNLIGKQALIESGDSIAIRDGVPAPLAYSVPAGARSATLTVYAADGTPVRVFRLDTTPGARQSLVWDGADDRGVALPDGEYRIAASAIDADGGTIEVSLYQPLTIDAVSFDGGGLALISGEREIPLDTIVEFRAAPADPIPVEAAPTAGRQSKQVTNVP